MSLLDPINLDVDSEYYPLKVRRILEKKAPLRLTVMGNLDLFNDLSVGFCGARSASAKGIDTASDCAEQSAMNGITVISGNAAGVDFAAHYNALKYGGKTILVLPEGMSHFRIKKNLQEVWDWERVLVVSQFDPQDSWKAFRAMIRNQLIIALSGAMIVIEAGEKGGTLNAGKESIRLNVPLFVAEYENMVSAAQGNKLLLDMGASRLAKNKTTGRANMLKIFDTIKYSTTASNHASIQGSLF